MLKYIRPSSDNIIAAHHSIFSQYQYAPLYIE